jgi:hypothetical protein
MVSSWSKAWMDIASLRRVHSSLAASASAYDSPPTTRSTPYPRMRSIFAGEETRGRKIFAGIPSWLAA